MEKTDYNLMVFYNPKYNAELHDTSCLSEEEKLKNILQIKNNGSMKKEALTIIEEEFYPIMQAFVEISYVILHNDFSSAKQINYDDLMNDAYDGLLRAINFFDTRSGYHFSSCVEWWIGANTLLKRILDRNKFKSLTERAQVDEQIKMLERQKRDYYNLHQDTPPNEVLPTLFYEVYNTNGQVEVKLIMKKEKSEKRPKKLYRPYFK